MNSQGFLAGCTHQRVISRPVGGSAIGWTDCWVCDLCSKEFVPRENLDALADRLESMMIATAPGLETHLDHEVDEARALLARLRRPVATDTPLPRP